MGVTLPQSARIGLQFAPFDIDPSAAGSDMSRGETGGFTKTTEATAPVSHLDNRKRLC